MVDKPAAAPTARFGPLWERRILALPSTAAGAREGDLNLCLLQLAANLPIMG
jgi:hypothetical protein